jgi:diguanylate cyclase (GGDEF)-like protein
MTGIDATSAQERRAGLRGAVQAELARTGLSLGFTGPLRFMYETEQKAARIREIRVVAAVGIAAYVAIVLLINWFVIADPSWLFVTLQLVVTPALASFIVWRRCGPEASPVGREAGATAAACCFSGATVLAVCNSPAETAIPNLFLVTLPVAFTLFFVRLRFTWAVGFTVVSAACLAAVLLLRHDLPPALRAYPLAFLLATAAPALLGVHRLERASRRVWLHGVLQSLHIEDLASENQALNTLSVTDSITGVANRRRLDLELETICARAPNGDCLLLIDIDHFKLFNDRFGHLAGDACLREMVGVVQTCLAPPDLLARFGGEEFAIALTEGGQDQARHTADRIHQAVAAHSFTAGGTPTAVTISIGATQRCAGDTAATLVARADTALYEAKQAGRNTVRWAAAPCDPVALAA